MKRFIIYQSILHNPIQNFALEEALFYGLEPGDKVLVLWVNSESVIIGRNQNPWLEANVRKANLDGVPIIRRLSGGGAVFHDQGNINYTFMSAGGDYDTHQHFQLIIEALKSFGITLTLNERSDLTYGRHKVSGNAFYFRGQRKLHHGTLLISTNEQRLWKYLTPENLPITGKGIASRRSDVLNLKSLSDELSTDSAIEAIRMAFKRKHPASVEKTGRPLELLEPHMRDTFDSAVLKYQSWIWTYGETPTFTYQIDATSDIKIESGRVIDDGFDFNQIPLSGIKFKEGKDDH